MSIASVFTEYFEWLLHTIAEFLGSAPICYVFYLCIFSVVISVVFRLLSIKS